MITILPSLCRCTNCGRIFIGLKASGGFLNKESKMTLCRRCREEVRMEKKNEVNLQ